MKARRASIGVAAIAVTLLGAGLVSCGGDDGLPVEPIVDPGDYTRSFSSGGRTRTYDVHVPPGYNPAERAAVVLVFHGVPRGAGMRVLTGFDNVADTEGFIVVYLNAAQNRDWAVGCDLCTWAERNDVDDVRFVRDLIRKLAGDASVDLNRVYATGFSQGALFTLRLACELSGEIAAFASVAATMLEPVAERCAPVRPVPMLLILGTQDPQFPWEGRQDELVNSLSAEATTEKFAELNGCESPPQVTSLPDTADDGTTVQLAEYPGCDAGSELLFYIVENGGHTWPDAPVEFSPAAGLKTRDINASDLIATFFDRHAM